jgi:hypothetical protein
MAERPSVWPARCCVYILEQIAIQVTGGFSSSILLLLSSSHFLFSIRASHPMLCTMHTPNVLVLSLGPILAAHQAFGFPASPNNGGAIYMLTNEASNAVVAVPIGQDGLLNGAAATSTATGGAGANAVDASDGKPAAPDGLFSQQAVTIAGSHVFAVNPGSNTLSMFAIDARDPTKLTMVGKPAGVPGEFPVTVAASSKHNLACVGTTGAKAGISCAPFSAQAGLGTMDALRPFNLGQSTPPAGPLNTVSQVFFSNDQATLFSTVKGDPPNNKTGFLAAFPVVQSSSSCAAPSVSQQGINSTPNGTAVLFGTRPVPGSTDLFATDASFGAAVLGVDTKDIGTVKGKAAIAGQKATCWATISPCTKTAFVTDVATDRLVEMSLSDATILNEIDLSSNGDPGLIDLEAAGDFVYALSPGNGTTKPAVTVVNAKSKKQVQHLQLAGLLSKNAQGMAILA